MDFENHLYFELLTKYYRYNKLIRLVHTEYLE